MNYINSPEELNPIASAIGAVLAWGALYVSLQRSAVREHKEARLHRARMAQERQTFLRRPQL